MKMIIYIKSPKMRKILKNQHNTTQTPTKSYVPPTVTRFETKRLHYQSISLQVVRWSFWELKEKGKVVHEYLSASMDQSSSQIAREIADLPLF